MPMVKILISLSLIFFLNLTYAGDLTSFTSDGCSSFPDGTLEQKTLWQQCCFAHDKAYWQGGVYGDREKADFELRSCVAGVGEPAIAVLMLAGVRVGGSPIFPTAYRWGYGWPYFRWYQALTKSEQEEVRVRLAEYEASNIKRVAVKQK